MHPSWPCTAPCNTAGILANAQNSKSISPRSSIGDCSRVDVVPSLHCGCTKPTVLLPCWRRVGVRLDFRLSRRRIRLTEIRSLGSGLQWNCSCLSRLWAREGVGRRGTRVFRGRWCCNRFRWKTRRNGDVVLIRIFSLQSTQLVVSSGLPVLLH